MEKRKGLQLPRSRNQEPIRPRVCVPLTGRDRTALLGELAAISLLQVDIIEWRIDFYSQIANMDDVIRTVRMIKEQSDSKPLLVTKRSTYEGGERTTLTEEETTSLYERLMETASIDAIDVELRSDPTHIERLRAESEKKGVDLIVSYHNFMETPDKQLLKEKIVTAEKYGADIAKLAVMPQSLPDVLALWEVTYEASAAARIPVVTMAMGEYGAVTRLVGGTFGSALTFAAGTHTSAPGQLPIDDVQAVLGILERAWKS